MSSKTQSITRKRLVSDIIVNGVLLLIVLVWTIPTLGLLVSSFRTRFDIQTSGWWWILPHREWVTVEEMQPDDNLDPDGIMEISGVSGTFEEFREGVKAADGTKVTWVGNKRLATIQIQERKWVMRTDFTMENYGQVLAGKAYEIQSSDGSIKTVQGDNFTGSFLNSLTIAIPATVIPILIAAFAAYGFAWMSFPGRKPLFTMVVALMVVPLQIALVPILKDYVRLDLNGTFLAVWLAHTGFGLPLATYLLFNYIKGLPRDILESAFIDGASHFTIFVRLILPLSIPALASFAIFQFLWVWNDYLIALVFIGAKPDVQVLTMRIAEMVGSRGSDWHLLTAGAFISMLLPLIVFFSLQRFFVRGLLAGSVKG
ncbi:MAG: carbohydrate ABC transporter permease [Chloroflexi bacterium]|jgi:alpha-glucoside transport system permease protein|nr:carbohydrate ABC transporter permease [Chloroflexota bacterium]